MIDSKGKLLLFEEWAADRQLPKFKQLLGQQVLNPSNFTITTNDQMMIRMPRRTVVNRWGEFVLYEGPWWWRAWRWVVELFRRPMLITIEQFFQSVKLQGRQLEIVVERARGYEQAMIKAKQAGQQALYEQLGHGLEAHRNESRLLAIGLDRYLDEQDVVRFYKQSKRGLRLDWVANFSRQIPDAVLGRKLQADQLGCFDNYCVLHYDPQARAYEETEKQKAARRDPILFGMMQGRRRLYFVGDWVDEQCDLTLDQMADQLGRDAVKQLEGGDADQTKAP